MVPEKILSILCTLSKVHSANIVHTDPVTTNMMYYELG